MYSAMNNIANGPALYSILNPDTSSDSPSTKSYGVRFVSAKIVAIQIGIKIGNRILGHEINVNVEVKVNEFITTKHISIQRDIPTSYEIVCAIARTVPRSAYFEFLAHPAVRVAYTLSLAIAENKGAENLRFRIVLVLGVKLPKARAKNSAIIGAI